MIEKKAAAISYLFIFLQIARLKLFLKFGNKKVRKTYILIGCVNVNRYGHDVNGRMFYDNFATDH